MLLSDAVRKYIRHHDNPYTRTAYQYSLEEFRDIICCCETVTAGEDGLMMCDCILEEISVDDVEEWRITLRDRGLAVASINTGIKRIRAFFNYWKKRDVIQVSPARFLKERKTKQSVRDKTMQVDLFEQILAHAQADKRDFFRLRNVVMLALLREFGPRRRGVAALTIQRVPPEFVSFPEKGDRDTDVPMTPEAWALIEPWLKYRSKLDPDPAHDFLFVSSKLSPGNRYQPLVPSSIARTVRDLTKLYGGNKGSHSLRHLKGQEFGDARIPPSVARDVLGHQSVDITLEFYYNQDWDRLRFALQSTSGLKKCERRNKIIPFRKPGTSTKPDQANDEKTGSDET